MTATASKILWLAFGIAWFILRLRPERNSRKTPVRFSARDTREIVLLGGSLTGLGIIPVIYLASHFPRFADYPFVPVQGYLGIVVYLGVLWLFHRTHKDLGRNWSVSLDLRESHTLVTTGVYAVVRHPMYAGFWLDGAGSSVDAAQLGGRACWIGRLRHALLRPCRARGADDDRRLRRRVSRLYASYRPGRALDLLRRAGLTRLSGSNLLSGIFATRFQHVGYEGVNRGKLHKRKLAAQYGSPTMAR